MSRFVSAVPSLGLLLLTLAGCATDEQLRVLTDTHVDGERLYIMDTLNEASLYEIADLIKQNPRLKTAVFLDIDGSIDADTNLQTGLLIHAAGLGTYLPADAMIDSGGVDLFCAGHERTVERGAHVGVHSWYDEDGLAGADVPRDGTRRGWPTANLRSARALLT